MILLPVTLVIAAAAALINIWLAVRVTRGRVSGKIMIGDGGDGPFTAKMRAHANFAEYAPSALILLALIELAGGSPLWLWIAGAVFILARLSHAIGMDRPAPNPFRAGGAMITWLVILGLAGWALWIGYTAESAKPPVERTIIFGSPKA